MELLKYLQLKRLTGSDASIFLTNYAFKLINGIKAVSTHKIIHHGIDPIFFEISNYIKRNISIDRPVTCIYVSNAAPYKHQWVVIEAISRLREMTGLDIRLDLIGARSGQSASRVLVATERFDPAGTFVRVVDFLAHDEVPQAIAAADIFVFASSCENLPITLLEGMASGLPIACSDRGPMTEVLGDGGVFFDPENPGSISDAIGKIIFDTVLRNNISQVARDRARKFTWESCSEQTWKFLSEIARRNIVNAHV
ncbi:MAG: glycosyltransferase [Caldilineaceae bacterium]|nr:glycosyltransferase [Caldilineaceae bacterium]